MTNFFGTTGNDVANSALGEIVGFTGGTAADLSDGIGDYFSCLEGNEFVFAGGADDLIEGGQGSDQLNGAEGNDIIYANTQFDISGSLDGDQILGNLGNDQIYGSAGNDDLEGGDGADVLYGGGGTDTMYGEAGSDRFVAFLGDFDPADTIYGGSGSDVLELWSANIVLGANSLFEVEKIAFQPVPAGTILNLTLDDGNIAAGQDLNIDATLLAAGTTLNLDFSGETDGRSVFVLGGAGTDHIIGRPSDGISTPDTIDLGTGGSDSYVGGGIVDFGTAFDSGDRVVGRGAFTGVYVDGDYSGGLTLTRAMLKDVDFFTVEGTGAFTTADNLLADGESMTFIAGAGPVSIDGSAETDGSFYMAGGAGDDTFIGGAGADVFVLSAFSAGGGQDTVDGGAGDDMIFASQGATFPDSAADHIDGGSGFDLLTAALSGGLYSGHDIVNIEKIAFVNQAGNSSYSLYTDDLLVAAGKSLTVDCSGVLTYFLTVDGRAESDGSLAVIGSVGADTILAGAGKDTLSGAGGNDTLAGYAGGDTLMGGAGRDSLDGGAGKDTLTGGGGRDTFVFADAGGADKVTDFEDGKDVFDLTGVAGVDSFSDLGLTDTGPSIEVDYGSGSFLIVNVGKLSAIDASDFLFA